MKTEDLWIFAYGSLCWQPGFEYEEMIVGHIKGWVRRFWQGNQVHRGTPEKVKLHKSNSMSSCMTDKARKYFHGIIIFTACSMIAVKFTWYNYAI